MTAYWARVERLLVDNLRALRDESGRPIAAVLLQVGMDEDDPRVFELHGMVHFGEKVPRSGIDWDVEFEPIADGPSAPHLSQERSKWLRDVGLWIEDVDLDDEDRRIETVVAIERRADQEISALALRASQAGGLDLGAELAALVVHARVNDDDGELELSVASNPASRHAELLEVLR